MKNPHDMPEEAHFVGLAAVLALLVLFYLLIPLGSALEFGGDEGTELSKGFMCSKGFALYKDIWNDQPPVFTMLLAAGFKAVGPSLLAARLLAAGFGLLLFGVVYSLVRERAGALAALLATFLLFTAPNIALLSCSVMLEVPAIAAGLLSGLLLFRWQKGCHYGWLLASGIVMGTAMQIKVTAVLVAPALLTVILIAPQSNRHQSWWKTITVRTFQWATAAAVAVTVVGATWAKGSLQSSWKSHFSEQLVSGMGGPEDFPFQTTLLWDHIECVAAAAVGLLLMARQRRWAEISFPIVMLTTALVIHAVHRPWWSYYYLHLAVPLAWLAGIAASEVIRAFSRLLSPNQFQLSSSSTWKGITLCALTALVLVRSERRFEAAFRGLRECPRADTDPIVIKMKEYADRSHWVYSQREAYAFHARLSTPPELTVVVLKRFWSKQLTVGEMVDVCRRYQVEQVMLKPAMIRAGWQEFLRDFVVVHQDKDAVLFVAGRLVGNKKDAPQAPAR
jgi:4-amino-4-deoxy-L-arabinose transferase-like glycosyltransferase